jgi:hypothetical protein
VRPLIALPSAPATSDLERVVIVRSEMAGTSVKQDLVAGAGTQHDGARSGWERIFSPHVEDAGVTSTSPARGTRPGCPPEKEQEQCRNTLS